MVNARSKADVAQLVAKHHQAVYRYAFRLTGTVHDAEDLTQLVFLTAQGKIGQLRNLRAAESWLFSILKNAFLKQSQRNRPRPAVDLDIDVDLIPDMPEEDRIDPGGLQQALNRLPDHFRLVVAMFYFEELSYREIAEELEMPIGTVMSRLARAKVCLRRLIDCGADVPAAHFGRSPKQLGRARKACAATGAKGPHERPR